MSYECFEVEISDQVAHIVLSRPAKRNSMTPAFWRELPQIVEDIDAGAKARVIVISSTGPHFCAGLDISGIGSGSDRPHRIRRRASGRPSVTVRVSTTTPADCRTACRR